MTRFGYQAARQAEIVEAGSRACKPHRCQRCGATCLRGDDHDACAMVVTVDTEPIDAFDEAIAIEHGRATYNILPCRGKLARANTFELHYRQTWHYRRLDDPILIEHECRG